MSSYYYAHAHGQQYNKKRECSWDGSRLNREGYGRYKDYKDVCPTGRDFSRNPCEEGNMSVRALEAKAHQYAQCGLKRRSFTNECVVRQDSGHQHAEAEALKMSRTCKNIARTVRSRMAKLGSDKKAAKGGGFTERKSSCAMLSRKKCRTDSRCFISGRTCQERRR